MRWNLAGGQQPLWDHQVDILNRPRKSPEESLHRIFTKKLWSNHKSPTCQQTFHDLAYKKQPWSHGILWFVVQLKVQIRGWKMCFWTGPRCSWKSRNFWEFDHKHHFLVKHHSPLLGGFCEPPFQSKGWDYKWGCQSRQSSSRELCLEIVHPQNWMLK